MVATADENDNALFLPVFQKLNAIRKLKLARPAWRHAEEEHRITLQETALAQLIKVFRPGLEGSHFGAVGQIAQQPIGVHLHTRAGLHEGRGARSSPVSSFSRRWT